MNVGVKSMMALFGICEAGNRPQHNPDTALRPVTIIAGLALLLAVVSGCGGGGNSATDTTPPTFAGIKNSSALASSITLSWGLASDNVTAAQNMVYLIYRANTAGSENYASPTFTSARGALSYDNTGLAAGSTYYYVVRAMDEAGNIDTNTVEIMASTDTMPPTFAGATGAAAAGSTSITVSWATASDNIAPASGITYLVYRATTSGGQVYTAPTAATTAGATFYTDIGLNAGTTYYYVVRAKDEAGNIDTNTVQVNAATNTASTDTTPPTFAGANSLTVQANTSMTVIWDAASDNVTTAPNMVYVVYRATTSGGQNFASPLTTTAAGATSYADTTATGATKYYYVVRAKDQAGNMDSNTAQVFGPVSFSSDIYTPLMASTCAITGCHSAAASAGSLDLSTKAKAYTDLVNVIAAQCSAGQQYVVPGSSSTSYLVNKLTGTLMCSGSQMPKVGSFFTATQLNTVKAWIDQGALNN